MSKWIVLLVAATAFAAEAPKSSLTEAQRIELLTATLTHERAMTAVFKLDSDYLTLRRKALEKAEAANAAFAETVKKLQALKPDCPLDEDGKFNCPQGDKK